MGSYSEVFGGANIYPAQLTFKNISLTADLTLEWPAEIATTNDVVAWIMRVSPSAGGFSIILDDATLASNGVSLLFYNAGAFTFTLKDSTGGTIASITAGIGWDIILRDNSTAAGSWLVIQRGAGTTEAQASQLAGAGLVALGGLLASSVLVTDRSSDFPITSTGRATLYDWTGGSGAATVDATSTLGTGWWSIVRNDGSGALTVTPASGQIDSTGSKVFDPNSAAFIFQDGINLFTVGFDSGSGGTSFDYVSIDISSGSGSTYTLTGSQLNRIAYQFTGVLTGDVEVVIPSTVQEYWITNATTGAFNVAVRTSSQTPPGVTVGQGSSIIGYCNGTIFIQAAGTISVPVDITSGGTGATTASGARANLAAAGTAVDNDFSADQTVVSVDGGGAVGPLITAYRNSASPTATDIIGAFHIDGNNSTPAQITYAATQATILDATAASEDATYDFLTRVAGALAKRAFIGQGLVVGATTDGGAGTIRSAGAIISLAGLTGTTGTFSDTVAIAKAGIGLTMTSSAAGTAGQLISTDAGAVAAPVLDLFRNSASAAAADVLGGVTMTGRNSTPATKTYAELFAEIVDATAASEDGLLGVWTVIAGTLAKRLNIGAGIYTANATGGDPGVDKINAKGFQIDGVAFTGGKQYHASYVANVDLTAAIPFDDSPPLVSEGTQIISLGSVVTTSSTEVVRLDFSGIAAYSGVPIVAIFRASTLVGVSQPVNVSGLSFATESSVEFSVLDSPSASGTYTYTVRVGAGTSGTIRFNGTLGGRLYGGFATTDLFATPYEP